jgi:hypothetical protein
VLALDPYLALQPAAAVIMTAPVRRWQALQ